MEKVEKEIMRKEELLCRFIGIGAILIMEIIALMKGIDGIALSVSVGAIAGILGIKIGESVANKEHEKEKINEKKAKV